MSVVRRIDGEYGVWRAAGRPLIIEYRVSVLEEIRAAVMEGLRAVPRGGVEVGGVLYGRRERDLVQITARRPLNCEHALGPAFLLSGRDEEALAQLLAAPEHDRALAGTRAVGWYHSHTRSEINLTERDLEIHARFFAEAWQIALVVRPHQSEPTRAAFFVRGADGAMRAEPSHEFVLNPHARRDWPHPEMPRVDGALAAAPAPAAVVEAPPKPAVRVEPPDPPARRRRWRVWAALSVLVVGAVALALAGAGWIRWAPAAGPPAILLRAIDAGGQLIVSWNRGAAPVRNAQRGVLEIADGNQKRSLNLDREQLAKGSVTYARRSAQVEVRLRVLGAGGIAAEELASFFGDPIQAEPAPPDNGLQQQLAQAQRERDEAVAEAQKARAASASQAARIKELESALSVLRRRLEVESTLRPR